jgi:hypothetical protein
MARFETSQEIMMGSIIRSFIQCQDGRLEVAEIWIVAQAAIRDVVVAAALATQQQQTQLAIASLSTTKLKTQHSAYTFHRGLQSLPAFTERLKLGCDSHQNTAATSANSNHASR